MKISSALLSRPQKDFVIESIEANAKLTNLPNQQLILHFQTLVRFLLDHNLVNPSFISTAEALNRKTELRNADLSDRGFQFLLFSHYGYYQLLGAGDPGQELPYLETAYALFLTKETD